MREILLHHEKIGDGERFKILIKDGDKWVPGAGYGTALKNAYIKRVGENL